ncbi:MAG: tetratricopeptide repeat protein [Elusimicrobiota bacterium]
MYGLLFLVIVLQFNLIAVSGAGEYETAISLMNENKYEDAIVILEKLTGSNARDLHLGIALSQVGRIDEAKKYLHSVLEKNPGLVVAEYTLAMIYEKEKSYDSALFHWNSVLANSRDKKLRELALRHIELIKELK